MFSIIPLLSLLVVLLVVGLLIFVLLLDTGRRGGALSEAGKPLGLAYRPYAALSSEIRDARFVLLECGQFRHFRHLLEGRDPRGVYVNFFDYSIVTPGGTSTQTLLLMECKLPFSQRFEIEKNEWLSPDTFCEGLKSPLYPLRPEQKPMLLKRWHISSDQPHLFFHRLTPELTDWLLAHPHLHIEWSAGILLICRAHHIIEPDQIDAAIQHALELARILSNPQE